MPRASTTSDVFNAVAEPRRREILDVLDAGEMSVSDIVDATGQSQPQVSKHLAVLRETGVVQFRKDGRSRLYRINGPALAEVHAWIAGFAQHWNERLDRLDDYLAELQDKDRS